MNIVNAVTNKIKLFDYKKFLKGEGALITFIVLFLFATFKYDQFFTLLNFKNVLRQVSMLGFVAIGMTFVILIGGIDLSVGSTLAVAGVVAAKVSPYGIGVSIIIPVLIGIAFGVTNGILVTKLKIVPFIATLATMLGIRGIAYIVTGELSVGASSASPGFIQLGRGYVAGIPIPSILFVLAIIAAVLVSKKTKFGRHVYAVGGNEEASKMMGLKVHNIKIVVYAISGALSAFAGVILTSRLGAGQPVAGEGWELTAIAATVIGGTLITGGVGKFTGTLYGVLITGIIQNMFNMQGNLNVWWQNILMGAILLGVVVAQSQTARVSKSGNS
ncbi:MAG: transporter permease [Clostridia bacterium]|jgi:ribose transport system permease protein|nr:transporter permease [Clostridia bacterium]